MSAGPLVVTYPLTGRSRAIVAEELGETAEAIYLVDLAPADRAHALGRAGAVLSHDTSKELRPDEILLIRNARLLQFTAAGVDWVPTRDLPRELPVAANKGGGAEPMSEHIVALALAAAKRLFIEHAKLKHGEFNQRSANRMLRGGVCGILGFGNVGVATARPMRAFGMKNSRNQESIRICGVFTLLPEQHQRHCRLPAADTIARREAGACHRACAFGSIAASARRVLSTASADAWRNAC
jgi:phosphoglycerate dehydrogenase-like enzyme